MPGSARSRWRSLLGSRGLQLLVVLLLGGWLLANWIESLGGPHVLRQRFGLWAAAVLVPVQAVVTATPASGEMIGLAHGALYGFSLGSLFNWVGWMLASFLQYAVVRRTARDFDVEKSLARLPRFLRRFPVDHPGFLIGVRIPLGGHIVNSAAGAFGVPLWRHAWCAALGIAPRAMFFAGLGTGLLHL